MLLLLVVTNFFITYRQGENMQISKEKLTYLLFLYKQKDMNYTATRMAKEVGVSKSTFSRVCLNVCELKARMSC